MSCANTEREGIMSTQRKSAAARRMEWLVGRTVCVRSDGGYFEATFVEAFGVGRAVFFRFTLGNGEQRLVEATRVSELQVAAEGEA